MILQRGKLTIELDKNQVNPDDPGNGTPAMVYWQNDRVKYFATYWCAIGEGELDGGEHGMRQLTEDQIEWLEDQSRTIDQFLYGK